MSHEHDERLGTLDRLLSDRTLDSRVRRDLFREGQRLWGEAEEEVWGSRGLSEDWLRPVKRWRSLPHSELVRTLPQERSQWVRFHTELDRCRERWSWRPVEAFARALRTLPEGAQVADFGAGTGQLAKLLKETRSDLRVRSFDLLAWDETVEVCDCANTPLEDESTDVVVLSCALWGDAVSVLREARRVLREKGEVLLAEPVSHWEDGGLEELLQSCGFAATGFQRDDDDRFEYGRGVKVFQL